MNAVREFLERVEARHGGRSGFEQVSAVSIQLQQMRGMIPFLKGIGRTFTMPERIVVYPHQQAADFLHADGTVRFERGSILTPNKRFDLYRARFAGWRKLALWTNRDAAYFFGYSLVNYFSLPFLLRDLPVGAAKLNPGHESWIQSEFPADADTHSRVQRFWFDDTGLLIRHDYKADILGPMTYGAHHSRDYRFDLPIPIAQRRVVVFRMGTLATSIKVLTAEFKVEEVLGTSLPVKSGS